VVKVKYGRTPEIPAEIAATRLLRSLGFAADEVVAGETLECVGCPPHPFRTRQLAEMFFLSGVYDQLVSGESRRVYRHVAVERKFDAPAIEAGDASGWEWSELDRVNPSLGGASRADLDALRLVAVLLAHWDNKPSNQRLVCLDSRRNEKAEGRPPGPCQRPLLMLHDLGATFGPKKLDHANWTRTPIWARGPGCVATMDSLPYEGATFRARPISMAGRQRLAQELVRLSKSDMRHVFLDAGFPDARTGTPRATDVSPWVETLQQKIAEIVDPPCTSGP
jgi:hypothetical protein